MSPSLLWSDIAIYSLQLGLLVGIAAFVPVILRLRLPQARLVYWQILLAACLVLPAVQPWRHEVITARIDVSSRVLAVREAAPTALRIPTPVEFVLAILAVGVAARLIWLAVGFLRLRRYRLHGRRHSMTGNTEILLSAEVSSPVTFGLRQPVVLLPERFPALHPATQEAILCHELLHVERRDWLFTLSEELIRSLYWFHPAIWWLLGEIQLTREQTVDCEVVRRTRAREQYLDALLTMASAASQPDLAPAPLFLRKRHLKQRVVAMMKEVRMSKKRLVSGFAAAMAILVASCWLVTGSFPLAASPQVVTDAAGVSVDLGPAAVLHRTPVVYPERALRNRVQGTVTVEATLDAGGNVTDARVLSGPDDLRKSALESVLQWHFANGAAGAIRQVAIAFQLPAATTEQQSRPTQVAPAGTRTVKSIEVAGLPESARSELKARLPVKEGDILTPEKMGETMRTAREYDEHLSVRIAPIGPDQAALTITAPGAPPPPPSPCVDCPQPTRLRIGGAVQQQKLVQQPRPKYPPEAKAQRIQGKVQFQATIGTDGTIKNLDVMAGEPILVDAAREAVQNWVYQPTLLNGNPVEVVTMIDVNFTLSQ
jgi:TonB family protein